MKKLITMLLSLSLVMGMAAVPSFAAAKKTTTPKTTITEAKVYYNNNVKLTWKKASGAVKYKVYRKRADQSKYTLMYTTVKTSYRNEDLKYNTKYSYKIKAVNKSGKGNYSNVKTITTKKAAGTAVQICEKYTNAQKKRNCNIAWRYSEKEKDVVSYTIYRRRADTNYVKLDTFICKYVVKPTAQELIDYARPDWMGDPMKDQEPTTYNSNYPYMTMSYWWPSKNTSIIPYELLNFTDHTDMLFDGSGLTGVGYRYMKAHGKAWMIKQKYNTTYCYKVVAKYADGSTRASKTVKLKTHTLYYDGSKDLGKINSNFWGKYTNFEI